LNHRNEQECLEIEPLLELGGSTEVLGQGAVVKASARMG
jgi:hypothetical protein